MAHKRWTSKAYMNQDENKTTTIMQKSSHHLASSRRTNILERKHKSVMQFKTSKSQLESCEHTKAVGISLKHQCPTPNTISQRPRRPAYQTSMFHRCSLFSRAGDVLTKPTSCKGSVKFSRDSMKSRPKAQCMFRDWTKRR